MPRTLALVDDDAEYSEYLSLHIEALGVDVHRFADSNDLLTSDQPFDFGFGSVDLMLPGVACTWPSRSASSRSLWRCVVCIVACPRRRHARSPVPPPGPPRNARGREPAQRGAYRLRRRVERVTLSPAPLQTQARVGDVFRAALGEA